MVLGPDNNLKAYIGAEGEPDRSRPGWPNLTEDGKTYRPPLQAGAFNTPHGAAVDSLGNIYVSEWLIGGRLDKLTRAR